MKERRSRRHYSRVLQQGLLYDATTRRSNGITPREAVRGQCCTTTIIGALSGDTDSPASDILTNFGDMQ